MTLYRNQWPDSRAEQLKELWAAGWSCSKIAMFLGDGLTRNAVIGKVTRMGLPLRGSADRNRSVQPVKKALPKAKLDKVFQAVVEKAKEHQVQEPVVLPDGRKMVVTDLQRSTCRWPLGDPLNADFHFCGNQAEHGPYCQAHGAMAYQPNTKPATGRGRRTAWG